MALPDVSHHFREGSLRPLPNSREIRRAILRELYQRGEPVVIPLLLSSLHVTNRATLMYDDCLDVLRAMAIRGDLTRVTIQNPLRSRFAPLVSAYYLSAREFVKMANKAGGEEPDVDPADAR